MSELTITTNHVPREFLYWHDLTAREKRDFDYLDTEDRREDATFFRYKGRVYSLGEFLRPGTMWMSNMPAAFEGWDSYAADSFFSGVLIKLVDEGDRVVVGWYCC